MVKLAEKFNLAEIEAEVRDRLSGVNLDEIISRSEDREMITFIEGPPTMNGTPHAGHLRGRVIKDFWYRYQTLRGRRVIFNAGWDTQGLPVELQAQKELGVEGGRNEIIESVGIERLVSACKDLVIKYNKSWVEADKMLGVSLNQERAYWTYKDGFIEREWQFLRRANEEGILQDDFTVIAYCPGCQTSLSHAEVNQGYREVKDPSLYYKVKLADEDAYLVVWTTMPFTLVTDAMVGLHPDEEYCYVKAGEEVWVVGASRLEAFMEEAGVEGYSILKTVKGKSMDGRKYVHPLYDAVPELARLASSTGYHAAVSDGFVETSTGSGLVHLSPANGEEDIRIARERNVEIFCPIDDAARFTEQAGRYAGLYVRDADSRVISDLEEKGAMIKAGSIRHKYPHCWRSHHPVIWLARRGWFYKLDRLGDLAVRAAESVEYFFDQPKNRFLGIIRERHPWCISRERFWGCPMPVWTCNLCGKRSWFYSRHDIVASAVDLPDGKDFELHRPWIDRIRVRCATCGGTDTEREQYVLDTWHNSGSAPFSSLTDSEYEDRIPAPFFTEGIDQTRGWAYTLLIQNVIMSGGPIPPYGSFLFQGHVLDKNGNKMSKSLGNVLDAKDLMTRHPADLVRFYFMWKSSPIEPLNFIESELAERPYKILNTLYHLHLYFFQNSRYDNFDENSTVSRAARDGLLRPPDVWILSKLQKLITNVGALNDRCRYHESAKALEDFLVNQLSQVYVRTTRAELWDEDESKRERRLAIYAVLHHALGTLDLLLHPFCPFITEYLYRGFGGKESMLLEAWPEPRADLEDKDAERSFDALIEVSSVAAAARTKCRMKQRWPLDEAIICMAEGDAQLLVPLSDTLSSWLNVQSHSVREVRASDDLDLALELMGMDLPVCPTLELKRERLGPRMKNLMAGLVREFGRADHADVIRSLCRSGSYDLDVDGRLVALERDDVGVSLEAGDGFAAARRGRIMVFVSTARNREMTAMGLVKDVARRLQKLRKERGYNPTDVLDVASVLDLDDEQNKMILERTDDLAFLVRVRRIDLRESCNEYARDEIDGQKIRISVE